MTDNEIHEEILEKRLTQKNKNKIIGILLFSEFIAGSQFLYTSSFFPRFVQDRYGNYISNFGTSVISSAFELAGVLTV